MKNVEIVWRTLADAALERRRDWNSIGDIADAASVAPSTTHQALGRLVDIGAVRANARRGYTVVSPEKLVDALAAHRNLRADTMVSTTLPAAQEFLDDAEVDYALSGSTAAVHYLGGRNTVADLGRRIVYTSRALSQGDFPAGDEVIILTEDPVAARTWRSGYASLAQTYADLWASPGWQAAEFTRALKARLFTNADWEQRASA
jgi:DNA-binding transcriptional regulator YhcF (GntR family)